MQERGGGTGDQILFAIQPRTQETDSRAATHQERPPSPQVVAAELEGIQWGNVTDKERDIITGPDVKGISPASGEAWYAGLKGDGATLFSKRDPEQNGWLNALVVPEKSISGPDTQFPVIDPARLAISKGGRESVYVRPVTHRVI